MQKGILNVVHHWAPMAEHRNCARHIYANWRKKYREKDWQKLFWACAKAPCTMLFNLARAKLAQCTPDGARDVMNTDPQHWSRAWFRLGSCCDSVDNNISETFNKWIVEARLYPVITMFETIRQQIMIRIQEMRSEMESWTGIICPKVLKKLQKSIDYSAYCHAIFNGNDAYEVKTRVHRYTVRLYDRTCSCRYWQLSGLPCSHAISCIHCTTNKLDDYIADCYRVDNFKKTYAYCLQALEGRAAWPVSQRPKPKAPRHINMPGRKKKCRTREEEEKPKTSKVSKVGTVIKRSLCKHSGHNKTTCKQRNGVPSASAPSASAPSGTAPLSATPSAPRGSARPPSEAPVLSSQQSTSHKRRATEEMAPPRQAKRRAPTNNNSRSNNFSGNTFNVHGSSNVNVNVCTGTSRATTSSKVTKERCSSNGSNKGKGTGKAKYARFRSLLGFEN